MTFDEFAAGVKKLLDGTAAGKGYNNTGADGDNELFDFVHDVGQGYGHALGEIIYKAKRFAAKKNPEDLMKAAAWAFLILQHQAKREAHHYRPLSIAGGNGVVLTSVTTTTQGGGVTVTAP